MHVVIFVKNLDGENLPTVLTKPEFPKGIREELLQGTTNKAIPHAVCQLNVDVSNVGKLFELPEIDARRIFCHCPRKLDHCYSALLELDDSGFSLKLLFFDFFEEEEVEREPDIHKSAIIGHARILTAETTETPMNYLH